MDLSVKSVLTHCFTNIRSEYKNPILIRQIRFVLDQGLITIRHESTSQQSQTPNRNDFTKYNNYSHQRTLRTRHK